MNFFLVWTLGVMNLKIDTYGNFSCCDGILVSKGYVTPKLEENIEKHGGIQSFLRWKCPVIGDSGAWLYKNQEEPPYSVRELLDYYVRLKIPVGAHLDHAIFTINVNGVKGELTLEFGKGKRIVSSSSATGIPNVPIFIKADNTEGLSRVSKVIYLQK